MRITPRPALWALAVALLSVPGCTPAEAPQVAPQPEETLLLEATPVASTELLYLRDKELVAYDLASGTQTDITELPTPDVAVSPDGLLLVAVEEGSPEGPGPEGYREPRLVVASTGGDETPSELGPGRSPVWAPSSAAVAAIAPTDRGESIVIYNLPGAASATTAPDDERWSIVGWRGTDVVAIGSRSGVVAIPTTGAEPTPLSIPPSDLWGVSPTGATHLAVEGDEVRIAGATNERLRGLDATLGDGSWSWGGGHVAVALLDGPGGLALIDVARADVTDIPEGVGAQGNVVWSATGDRFAFARVDPAHRGRLQAVTCTLDDKCDELFSWGRGVRLLAFR